MGFTLARTVTEEAAKIALTMGESDAAVVVPDTNNQVLVFPLRTRRGNAVASPISSVLSVPSSAPARVAARLRRVAFAMPTADYRPLTSDGVLIGIWTLAK